MKDDRETFLDRGQVAERLGLSEDEFTDLVSRRILPDPNEGELWSCGRIDARLLTLQKAATRRGIVYVVGFGQYVKIGFTQTTVAVRLASMQTDCPEPLEIFGFLEGSQFDEIRLLGKFIEHRTIGEWHRREGELAAWIEKGCPA